MGDLTVYRSTNPGVLDAWHGTQEWHRQVEAARRRVIDELGFPGRLPLAAGRLLVGVQHLPVHGRLPLGWRWSDTNPQGIVPDKRTTIGRAAWKRLQAPELIAPDVRDQLPGGMPAWAMDWEVQRRYQSGVAFMDGAVYVTWGVDLMAIGAAGPIDRFVWERVRLSAYYLWWRRWRMPGRRWAPMGSRTPSETIRAAVEVLERLPKFVSSPPRLVMGDGDDLSGLAWCEPDHSERDEFVCDCGLGVDMVVSQLADVTAGLLTARPALIAWLEDMLATYGSLKGLQVGRRPQKGSNLWFALQISEAIATAVGEA